ncbi:MAG: hypothetical protein AAF206_10720, partial [Bacteroidota bacterium]
KRTFTTTVNSISICDFNFASSPVRTVYLRRTGGNAIQYDNQAEDSTVLGVFTFMPISTITDIESAYFDQFEDQLTLFRDVEKESPLWEWGMPAGEVITGTVSGQGAWTTRLSGKYQPDEYEWLSTQCFDMSDLDKPMVSFDSWVDSER